MLPYDIVQEDVIRYLGFQNSPPDQQTLEDIAVISQELASLVRPVGTHRVIPLDFSQEFPFVGTNFPLLGEDIKSLLQPCSHALFMAVTLGHEFERYLRQVQVRDMAKAVILDACASSLVEEFCNYYEETLGKEYDTYFFTDRFSPGYGDLPLSVQAPLCSILNTEKTLGLSLSPQFIMAPTKSITAILGFAAQAQPMKIKGCGHCALRETCQLRKGGKTCGA